LELLTNYYQVDEITDGGRGGAIGRIEKIKDILQIYVMTPKEKIARNTLR
jgi:hypothetical protein